MRIPDITERFPEGFGGVDMTDKCFPMDKRYGYDYSCENDNLNIPYEQNVKPTQFKIGQEYRVVGFYGGVTYYTVKEINEDRTKILLAEHWVDLDGEGERKAEWHNIEKEGCNEKALEWTSEDFGDIWICAK